MQFVEKHSWKVFVFLMGLVAFLCPIIYWELQSKAYLFKLMIVFPTSAFLFALFLGYRSWKSQSLRFSLLDYQLLAFVLWMFVSLFWATTPLEGLKSISPWLAAFLLSTIMANIINTEDRMQVFLRMIIVSGAGIAAIGILQHFIGNKLFMVAAPPASTFGNRNMAGQYVVICLPFALVGLFDRKNWWRYVAVTCGWIMLTYEILIRSRAIYLALLVQGTVLVLQGGLWFYKTRPKINFLNWKAWGGIAVMIVGSMIVLTNEGQKHAMAPMSFSEKLTETTKQLEGKGKYGSNERIPTWKNTLEMVKDNPVFGVGAGQWKIEFPHYNHLKGEDIVYNNRFALTRLHNDVLEYWATLGTIGLLLLAAPIVSMLFFMFQMWKTGENHFVAIASIMSVLGIGVPSLTSFPIQNIAPILFTMFVLQIAYFHYHKNCRPKTWSFTPIKWVGVPLACAFLIGAVLSSKPHYRMVKSNALYFKGDFYKNKHPQKNHPRVKKFVYQLYKGAYEQDPTDNIVIMRNIFYANIMGFPERAARIGRDAQKYFPYDKMIQRATFEVFWKSQNIKGMAEMANRLKKYSPRYHFTWVALGHTAWFSGRRSQALDLYEKAFTFKKPVVLPQEAAKLINKRRQGKSLKQFQKLKSLKTPVQQKN